MITKLAGAIAVWLILPLSPSFTPDEQAYLDQLRGIGITFADGGQSGVNMGHVVCNSLASGESEDAVAQEMMARAPQLGSLLGADVIIRVAVTHLCPSQRSKLG